MGTETIQIFVAGTDTGVGKTRVSCALLKLLARHHARVVGMKPVSAGWTLRNGKTVSEDAWELRQSASVQLPMQLINPVSLAQPLSPHLAAAHSNVRLSLGPLLRAWRELSTHADVVVVEGAGVWLTPLNDTDTMATLAQAMRAPVVLVVGMRLGCLNHALLSARAITADGVPLAGWVANVIDRNMACLQDNIATLQALLKAPLLGCIPWNPDHESPQAGWQLPSEWTDPRRMSPS